MINHDVASELNRLFMEILGEVTYGEKFNCLTLESRDPNSFSSKITNAVETLNEVTMSLDRQFLWRFFDTKSYKKFSECHKFIEDSWLEIYKKKLKSETEGDSMMDQLLRRPGLDIKDVNAMAVDLLLAGVDTTSNAVSMVIYHISKNQDVQEKLYEEAKRVLPLKDDPITLNIINAEIPYIRAVVKESMRLNPAAIGVGRMSNSEMVLGGYLVPKNVSEIKF